MRVWDSETGHEVHLRQLSGPTNSYETLPVFSPTGRWLLTGGSFTPFTVRDLTRANAEPLVLKSAFGGIRPVFSGDGKTIATVGFDGVLRIWETETGKNLDRPKLREPGSLTEGMPVNCMAYRADGRAVILGWGSLRLPRNEKYARNHAQVHDTLTGEPLGEPLGHPEPVNAAAFSHDGATIVTVCGQTNAPAGPSSAAKLWQRAPDTSEATWQFAKELVGHKEVVIGAAFGADDEFLVTASRDNTARVWRVRSGEVLAVLDKHRGDVSSAEFSQDGRFILTSSLQDGTARIWDVTTYPTPTARRSPLRPGPVS